MRQSRLDLGDLPCFGLAADHQQIVSSQGDDLTDWQKLAGLHGRALVSGIDEAATLLLRQRAPLQIMANSRQEIIKLKMGHIELVSMERFGYKRTQLSTVKYGAKLAADLRAWLDDQGWKLRTSLGSTGLYDVLPAFLERRKVPGASLWLQRWRSELVAGLSLAGREYSEPGNYPTADCYDIQSAYGACCLNTDLPLPTRMKIERDVTPGRLSRYYCWKRAGVARCTVNLPPDRYGLLLTEAKGGGIDYHQGGGIVSGVWTLNELNYAVELGATIEAVEWVMSSTVQGPFLAEFAAACYDEKLAAQRDGDRAGREFWKLLLNGTIGRIAAQGGIFNAELVPWGQKLIKPPAGYDGLLVVMPFLLKTKNVNLPGNGNRIWTAIIVSEQRVRMHRAATACNAFYLDTDALICAPGRADGLLSLGESMGQWDKKGSGFVEVHATKMYRSEWDRPKARGIPKALANAFLAGQPVQFARRHSWRMGQQESQLVEVRRA